MPTTSRVIIVSEEELQDLIVTAVSRVGLSRSEELKWQEKLHDPKEPHFLGYSEDGMCLYEIRFSL